VDEIRREEAQARFKEIKDAYDVLMDENLRALYDDFGAEAVKKQMNMQVGKPLQSTSEFLRDMFRMRRQQHQAYIMRRVDHVGSFMVLVNAQDRRGRYRPELGTISVRQSIKFPLTSASNVRLSFNALMNGVTGQGTVKMAYERSFVAAAAAGYASLRIGWNSYAFRIGASKQLFDKTHGDLNFGIQDGTGRLRVKCVRQLSEQWNGIFESQLGPEPSVALSLSTRPDLQQAWDVLATVKATQVVTSSTISASYQLSDRSKISFTAGLDNNPIFTNAQKTSMALINSWHIAGQAERTISQLTKATVGFTIAPHGVFVAAGFTRHGQYFGVPVMLSHLPALKPALIAMVAPFALAFIIEAILLEPRRRRKRLAQEEKRRKQQEQQIAAAKARAQADCRLMADEVNRKREAEEVKGGLVILQAFYGRHPEMAAEFEMEDADDEELSCRVDVTLPLQYMVQNSQLQIPSGTTKSALIGFYDPIPDEEKWIEVVYLYKHKTHRVLVADHDSLRMPLKSHQMD